MQKSNDFEINTVYEITVLHQQLRSIVDMV